MNIKLNNNRQVENSVNAMPRTSVKEERRRTGRYIAILVGICLFLIAIYHAWVRRIPVVASLVIPALIMFIYVAWVLYTASRDKHKNQAFLKALSPASIDEAEQSLDNTQNTIEIAVVTNNDSQKAIENSPDWKLSEITTTVTKSDTKYLNVGEEALMNTRKPLILVNDELPDDFDQQSMDMTSVVVESIPDPVKIKSLLNMRRFRRKFCRTRKQAVFKRSYSIG